HFANSNNDGISQQWHSFYESNPPPLAVDRDSYTDGSAFVCLPSASYSGATFTLYESYSPFSQYIDQRTYTIASYWDNLLHSTYGLVSSVQYKTMQGQISGVTEPLTSCSEPTRAQRTLSTSFCNDVAAYGFSPETDLGFAVKAGSHAGQNLPAPIAIPAS